MDKIYKKAFTLIELLAIVVVISIFTIIFFIDYGKDSKVFALERASRKVAQDLRRTQEMAASGLSGGTGVKGYGIYFDQTSTPVDKRLEYILYNNINSVSSADMPYANPPDTPEIIPISEPGIMICDIKYGPVDNMTSTNNVSVSFLPPDPINYIQDNRIGYETSITLCVITNTNQKRTININNTGRIEITNP